MMGLAHLLKLVLLLSLVHACLGVGGRKLTALVQQPPLVLTYHMGPLLQGSLPLSVVWYGEFTPAQRSIISDFLSSLSHQGKSPSVSSWWKVIEAYLVKAGSPGTAMVVLEKQVLDDKYSLGKSLKRAQIEELAAKAASANGISLVLTSKDVAVEGFCMSTCGLHDSAPLLPNGERFAYIWVGNSESQCPGQCAWPFHQPLYGPKTRPLVAPNGDVGADGMIINIANMLAGTVTNPYKSGYFQGTATAPLEAASACAGIYGKNAYPGYAGELLVDSVSGASYNAYGNNGRRYLLPALWNPDTSSCYTLV